jgi:predicted dehydrogenase
MRAAGAAEIAVEIMTSVNGALLFESGANVAISLSWDAGASRRAPIELHGETGAMLPPDPNQFGGTVGLAMDGADWRWLGDRGDHVRPTPAALKAAIGALERGVDPLTGGEIGPETAMRWGDQRGLGVVDMVARLRAGLAPRASGVLAFHVLEVLLGLQTSAADGGRVTIASRAERPDTTAN